MTQEIDLESVLRSYFHVDPEKPVELTMWTNNEGRIVAKIGTGVDAPEYIVFGNNVCQYPPPSLRRSAPQFRGSTHTKVWGQSELKRPDVLPEGVRGPDERASFARPVGDHSREGEGSLPRRDVRGWRAADAQPHPRPASIPRPFQAPARGPLRPNE